MLKKQHKDVVFSSKNEQDKIKDRKVDYWNGFEKDIGKDTLEVSDFKDYQWKRINILKPLI